MGSLPVLFERFAECLPHSSLAIAANFIECLFQGNRYFAGSFSFLILANSLQILKIVKQFLVFLYIQHDGDANAIFVSYELFSFRHFLDSNPSLSQSKSRIKAKAFKSTCVLLFVAGGGYF